MYIFAYVCLLFALLCSIGGGGLALLQLWQNRSDHLAIIRKAQWAVSGSFLLASALLLHALFWEDYRLEYVASYTDNILPVFYKLTAFWAGQSGSMLFWGLVTALSGSLFACTRGGRQLPDCTALWFWLFFYATMAFFSLVLTGWSNPFLMQEPVPVDGQGLNPLLQNPGMIIHPPLLFMGYAGFTVPGCLALAQLLGPEREGDSWIVVTRPFYLVSWCLLTAGIVLGAWWAYMELGWGGYWAWDPVENASLLPWLVGTAALHVMAIKVRTGKLARTSALLIALAVVAAFFATYLTRSGVIQSVHAFGDGGVGTPLVIFVIGAFVLSLFVAASAPARGSALASPISREGALSLVAWLLLALALIVLLATMWPVISKMWGNSAQGLNAAFYNRVCLPLFTGLLILLCICPWLNWSGGLAWRSLGRFIAVCGAFMAALAAIWFAGYEKPLPLLAAAASLGIVCGSFFHVFDKSLWADRRKRAAFGAHAGLGLLALGVAFSGPYTTEREILFSRGQQENIGRYTVTLDSIKEGEGPGYDFLQAFLKISLGPEKVGTVAPERRIYSKFGSMQFSEVDVISSIGQDIYASLLGMDEDFRVLVKISLEPMVNWIWIGGALMCLLPLAGLGRIRRPAPDIGRRRQDG